MVDFTDDHTTGNLY